LVASKYTIFLVSLSYDSEKYKNKFRLLDIEMEGFTEEEINDIFVHPNINSRTYGYPLKEMQMYVNTDVRSITEKQMDTIIDKSRVPGEYLVEYCGTLLPIIDQIGTILKD